jgi:hypothetical protein
LVVTNAETDGHIPPLSVCSHFMHFVMSIKELHTPSTIYGIEIMGRLDSKLKQFLEIRHNSNTLTFSAAAASI